MSTDKLIYDLSQEIEGNPNIMVRKDWLNILDNQNQNYGNNQSIIDTSQLSNSNKYMSYREAYLSVPLLLTIGTTTNGTTFLPNSSATSADYCMGLKNWFGTIIHSFTLDYNGTTIIQQTPFINMYNSFQLITTLSWNDITTQGATLGFYPDNPLSWTYIPAGNASPSGQGTCNNINSQTTNQYTNNTSTAFNNYDSNAGNVGFLERQTYINFNPQATTGGNGAPYSTLLSATSCSQLWKSYISNAVNGTANAKGLLQISVTATIYLKHIASFFAQMPLLKGVFLKMTLALNNCSTNFSVSTAVDANVITDITVTNVSNAVGGVNPLMIAGASNLSGATSIPAGSFNLARNTAANSTVSYIANISVGSSCLNSTLQSIAGIQRGGVSSSVYLYVPAYTFNPVYEQAYLSSPIKQIQYTDVYMYQVVGIPRNGLFNNLLTNGIAGIQKIIILPFFSATATAVDGINTATQLPAGMPVYQSPFDTAGSGTTSPLCLIGNFNVVVSGQNAIYNTEKYSFEEFNNQLYGINAVNGGQTEGINSGLIDQLGFEMNYNYYVVDVSRMLPVEESVPKSVQIVGQNLSGQTVDYFCYIQYNCNVSVDALTGSRVA